MCDFRSSKSEMSNKWLSAQMWFYSVARDRLKFEINQNLFIDLFVNPLSWKEVGLIMLICRSMSVNSERLKYKKDVQL